MNRILIKTTLIAASLLLAAAAVGRAEEIRFLSRVRQFTFDGLRSGEGYFSPDGSKIIFQSERDPENPFYQIFILDLTTGETTRVSPGSGKTTCAFFRPGTDKVLFASTHLDPRSAELQREELEMRASGQERRYAWDYDEHMDIFEANSDGTGLRRLTDAIGYDAEAGYSPDGSKIVFSSTRSAYPLDKLSPADRRLAEVDLSAFGEIYIMNADGTGQTRLTDTPGYDGGPFFSPDGSRIVWRRFDETGAVADIFTMKTDGTDKVRVTDFGAMSWAPWYHPSGDYIIFASNKLGFSNFELYMTDTAGTREPVRVTSTDGFDGLPVFSPDGNRLCWTSTRHGLKGGQLYLAEWNERAARQALADAPLRGSASPGADHTLRHGFKPGILPDDIRADIGYLASPALEGRRTGSPGEALAADYISRRFAAVGLQPLPGSDDYRTEFAFTSAVRAGDGNAMELFSVAANPHIEWKRRMGEGRSEKTFLADKDFLPISFSDQGTTEGLLAFVGYGLFVPDTGGDPLYDSFGDLDLTGRIAIALRYVPEEVSPETRQIYNRYAGLRFKAMQARERGAIGLLVVSGANSPTSDTLVSLHLDMGGATAGLLSASINIAAADAMLASSGRTLAELQTELDSGEKTNSFLIEDRALRMTSDLEKERSTGHNVIGVLPPTVGGSGPSEYVILGAHYDHLGRGELERTLARKDEAGEIHAGADDNASGTSAILEIAESLAASPAPRVRGVIFAAWSGEEIGLLGSTDFTEDPPVPLDRIVANLNMDMIGRSKENKLTIQGVGSSPDWKGLIERRNIAAGFSLSLSDDPWLPTDSTAFYSKKIPTLHFFTGAHEDYHRPTDTPDKINYEDTARVASLVESIAREMITKNWKPEYAQVRRSAGPQGGRETMRAYLGTIPDYATEGIEGVKLSGVQGDGPADKAGLRGGDVIIEFAGRKITNIYDYTYALDAVKIGRPVTVRVSRDGGEVELTIIPEARK